MGGVATATYRYDAMGRQVTRTLVPSGVTIHSVFDSQGRRIAEYTESTGAIIREYVWMDWEPVAVIEGGVIYLIRADHIGRPSFATTLAGTKVWSAVYLPFGGVHVTTGAPIDARFPGQWFQTEAGLYQNWMRDYDPTTGRYIEADPLGLVDGASVYGYAGGNPGRYTDPSGEFIPIAVVIGGAALGYIIGEVADYVESACGCEPKWNTDLASLLTGASAADGFAAQVDKRFVTRGSTWGTSYQSKYLSRIGVRLPFKVYTPSGIQTRPFWKQTKNAGRVLGRWAPWISAGLITYDLWRISSCLWASSGER